MSNIREEYSKLLEAVKTITGATEQMIRASRSPIYVTYRAMIIKQFRKQGYTYREIQEVVLQKHPALINQLSRLEDDLDAGDAQGKETRKLYAEFLNEIRK